MDRLIVPTRAQCWHERTLASSSGLTWLFGVHLEAVAAAAHAIPRVRMVLEWRIRRKKRARGPSSPHRHKKMMSGRQHHTTKAILSRRAAGLCLMVLWSLGAVLGPRSVQRLISVV